MTKLVVLTGASSGIGRATALELASRACDLILTSRREALLSAVAADCGTQATYHVGDVGD
ncbi:SDR family NAD(P)-dependent oxidoreductase, partial [Escherichia coli]